MRPEHEREFREFVSVRSAALLRTAYLLTGDTRRADDLLRYALRTVAHRWAGIRRHDQPELYVRRALYRRRVAWWRNGMRHTAGTRLLNRPAGSRGNAGPAGLAGVAGPARSAGSAGPGRSAGPSGRTGQAAAIAAGGPVSVVLTEPAGLLDAMDRLSPWQRTILVVRYYEGQSEQEAAWLLGVSPRTVRNRAAKALARLDSFQPDRVATGAGPGGPGGNEPHRADLAERREVAACR